MIKLREYQEACVANVRAQLRHHRNVLLQAPTGAGKTAMATHMLSNVAAKKKRGFFICHRRELIDQTSSTFEKAGLKHAFIANGYPTNFYAPIQICSIDTLKNRIDIVPAPDVCIWDEAHHLGAAGWTRVHEFYDRAFHIGLSATPQRLDGKGLDDRFDVLVPGPPVRWLIEQGFLADYKLYSVPGVNLDGVHTRMGDFVKSESEAAMDRPTITGNIINHWRKMAHDKLTIGFAVSIKHSEHIVAQFRASGIMACHLDGNTPKDERRNVLRAFARGDIRVIFNVGLFGEGFDIAANSGMDVTVGCVIDAAPTQALGAWLQRCGRALRPQKGHAVILDHAGNLRHGLPCEERTWTLQGREKKGRGSGEEGITIKQCPECFYVHKPGPLCPECGHVYDVVGREIQEVDGELVEIDPGEFHRSRAQAKTIDELRALAENRGYNSKYADHVMRARQEKEALRKELFNLIVGAETAGILVPISRRQVYDLKPKALREFISAIRQDMTA